MGTSNCRSTEDVFRDHLRMRLNGEFEADVDQNYADDVVLLTGSGIYRGKEGVRQCHHLLCKALPCIRYEYRTMLVEGGVAFLEWGASCRKARVDDGADSYVIHDGRIAMQTIHYTVKPRRAGSTTSPKAGQQAKSRPRSGARKSHPGAGR